MPSRFASGAKISSVSRAMRLAPFLGSEPSVRMLCKRFGQFDEHHAHVIAHGDKHLAQRLGFLVLQVEHLTGKCHRTGASLVTPSTSMANFLAELDFQVVDGDERIFDHVVEQPGGYRGRVQVEIGKQAGDGQAVREVWFPADALLAGVRLFGPLVGAADLVLRFQGRSSGRLAQSSHLAWVKQL